jgi:dihydrofolate synthase/folylpolyglutamate synthase
LQHSKKISGLKGRWEILNSRDPLVIADVAHNEAGIKELVKQIELTPHRNLHIVFGMVKDKDIDNALALLPKMQPIILPKRKYPERWMRRHCKNRRQDINFMAKFIPM